MIFHFTCACGNAVDVDAESEQLANRAIIRAGWVRGITYKVNGAVEDSNQCPQCRYDEVIENQ